MAQTIGPSRRQEIEMNPADGGSQIRTLANLKSEIDRPRTMPASATVNPRCPKVPKSLLPSDAQGSEPSDDHPYEPMVMSLGPYHHGNPKLVRGEKIKLRLALDFFDHLKPSEPSTVDQPVDQSVDQTKKKVVDELYSRISRVVNRLRDYYDKESIENYSDEQFIVMMLVDGCALMRYMLYACIHRDRDHEYFDIRYEDLSHLHRDAMLLENQLPYELMEELLKMNKTWDTRNWAMLCLEFCGMTLWEVEPYSFLQKMEKCCCGWFPAISRISNRQRRPNPDEESGRNTDEESGRNTDEESGRNTDEESGRNTDEESGRNTDEESGSFVGPCHLLDLYLDHFLGAPCSSPLDYFLGANGSSPTHGGDKTGGMGSIVDVREQVMASFRNVKDLMAAGIRIKPSPTRFLRDISFTSHCVTACLRLPPITIDKSTKDMFFNLIAWEMSSNMPHDIIAYLRFLDSLIDDADDIKELQSAGVLQNNLGTHEEVAEFFNTVSTKLVSNFHAYNNVRVKIREHLKSYRNSNLKRWLTMWLDTNFDSPLTVIAWVGAALVLFFTAVQTYFTAFSH
ncbi:uncharacterized protein LOC117910078 [Vitis riparia]|uniref:uncharacterized protein LOC117910078 n=1 Tax=Vitis riparia TaxID=96939 RepID=UPI00155AE032|nr:uncharacterized protein LOC117910078 [Vitis riparia]